MQEGVVFQRQAQQMKFDEFLQLRSVLPSNSIRRYTTPIEVIEEAIKYIAHLQATLEGHDNTSMTRAEIHQQFREISANSTPRIKFKQRRIASFHARINSTPKPRKLKGQERRIKRTEIRSETTTRR